MRLISSLLNDLRVPVKLAREQLGHASISTTLKMYTHVVDTSHRAAIEYATRCRQYLSLAPSHSPLFAVRLCEKSSRTHV
jgi:hypothetical protein